MKHRIMMSTQNLDGTIAKYEHYINNVLREDLRVLQFQLDSINAEVSDLIQQRHALRVITDKTLHPTGFKTQVNLGCNFFMEAVVPDTDKLLVNIGLNHYLELNLNEANKYLDARIKVFELKSEELCQKTAETKAHIKLMLFGVDELQNSKFSKPNK